MRLLMACLLCALMCGCGKGSAGPEAELRQWVADAQTAVEEKDRRGLLRMISENYTDNRGNDHERIGQMLRGYFLRQKKITVISKIDEIVVAADTAADIKLTAGMAGTRAAYGFDADAYRFELELENDGDRWLLIGAEWGQLGDEVR